MMLELAILLSIYDQASLAFYSRFSTVDMPMVDVLIVS